MPALDRYHHAVRKSLEKDGWIITHDPYILDFGDQRVYTDLGAEAPIGAEKAGQTIAVEVKTFLSASERTELERTLGQVHTVPDADAKARP